MPRPIRNVWPEDARIAVVLQVPLEVWDGADAFGLTYVPKLPADRVRAGQPDLLTESFRRYAGEVGIWRLIDLIDRYQVPASGVFSGMAARDYPDVARAFLGGDSRREIAAHSWAQNVLTYELDADAMRANIRRTSEAIEAATGERPVGWVSAGGQFVEDTLSILAEEGFLYHGDYAHSDTAEVVEAGGRRIVQMSVPWDVNDYLQYAVSFNPPSAFVEMFRRSFDVLYREGGQIVGAVAHAGVYGHPFGVSAYEEIIDYALSKPDVWVTTRKAIAEWVLGQASERVVD